MLEGAEAGGRGNQGIIDVLVKFLTDLRTCLINLGMDLLPIVELRAKSEQSYRLLVDSIMRDIKKYVLPGFWHSVEDSVLRFLDTLYNMYVEGRKSPDEVAEEIAIIIPSLLFEQSLSIMPSTQQSLIDYIKLLHAGMVLYMLDKNYSELERLLKDKPTELAILRRVLGYMTMNAYTIQKTRYTQFSTPLRINSQISYGGSSLLCRGALRGFEKH